MAVDERLQWLIMEMDLKMRNRRMQDMWKKKANQDPSNFLKSSVSEIEAEKAKTEAEATAENQKQDRINGRKGVTEMEKQEDLHHINKKQKMEKQDRINNRKSVTEMEKQEDLHHINKKKKQMMETDMNQKEEEEEIAAIDKAPMMGISFNYRPLNFCPISPHLIPGRSPSDPSLPWPPPEEEKPWGIAGLGQNWF